MYRADPETRKPQKQVSACCTAQTCKCAGSTTGRSHSHNLATRQLSDCHPPSGTTRWYNGRLVGLSLKDNSQNFLVTTTFYGG
jgi:hypothetical protein